MYGKKELRWLVGDTLQAIDKYSVDAENLICGIIAQESTMGKYRRQLGGGPALGICQIEPNTFNDIIKYLSRKKELYLKIHEVSGILELKETDLINNDRLSICICRAFFLRFKGELPSTIEGYAKLWKLRYNTIYGKGTEEEFINNYKRYLL